MTRVAGTTSRTTQNVRKVLAYIARVALLCGTILLVNYGAKRGVYDKNGRSVVMLIVLAANILLLYATSTKEEWAAAWRRRPKS
jgi:hypothetical protein